MKRSVSLRHGIGARKSWSFDAERDGMFTEQLGHFLSCVEKGISPKVSLDDGVEVMTLIEAARQSNRERSVVYL
jgi:predicted dehydrogenase